MYSWEVRGKAYSLTPSGKEVRDYIRTRVEEKASEQEIVNELMELCTFYGIQTWSIAMLHIQYATVVKGDLYYYHDK